MKRTILTPVEYNKWIRKHQNKSWRPKKPYCKICSDISARDPRNWTVKHIEAMEEVYEVWYANGTYGLYHIKCIDSPSDPVQEMKVEAIKQNDTARWLGVASFVKMLRDVGYSEARIIPKIMQRVRCSRATAYRRLKRLTPH